MAIFTVHQWRDLRRGLRELRRVSSGPIVTSEEWRMLADGRLRQRYRISVDARRTWRMLFTLYDTKVTV